jgi:spore photoproduct lyase
MFEKAFVEKDILNLKRTQDILDKISYKKIEQIEKVEDIFGRVKKPYLQKRTELNIFLGRKKGELVKEAPEAYGTKGDPHYYFVHAYNCIYECQYCYLQGYFQSPDLVIFVNHEEILTGIEKKIADTKDGFTPWFHAGEYSDSLALSNITGELPIYFDFFKKHPKAKLELRTKSANIRELLQITPLKNVITSFSLSPEKAIKSYDLKTPPLKTRLKAMSDLFNKGHPIGLHLDPVIFEDNFEKSYSDLLKTLNESIPLSRLEYISLGVVRFSKTVFHQVKKNYPDSPLLAEDFIKGSDGKVRYKRPMRYWILNKLKNICVDFGAKSEKVYLCMEDED